MGEERLISIPTLYVDFLYWMLSYFFIFFCYDLSFCMILTNT